MKQTVEHKKLTALQGILLIAALFAVLFVLNFVFSLIAPYTGANAAALLFWLSGGLVAYFMMRTYVSAYTYELSEDVLRVNRKYGRRERFMEDIYLAKLIYVGSPEEAQSRHPGARRLRATHKSAAIPVTAVAYETSGGVRIALIQPNPEIRAKLIHRVKAK